MVMAAKRKKGGFFSEAVEFLASSGLRSALKAVSATVDDTLSNAQRQLREATQFVIKSSIIYILVLIGALFALVGLGIFISERVRGLSDGLGFVVVGGLLIILGMVSKALSR